MNRSLSVGLVVSAAAAILFLTILTIGQDQSLFTPHHEYTVLLPTAEGLQVGSPVKLVGVQVGVVKAIRLPVGMEERTIRVTLKVNSLFADRIRLDTKANLKVRSVLAGEKYIELTLGNPEEPQLEPGSEIHAPLPEFSRLFQQGSTIAGDMAEITASLRVIFERIQHQEGMLGQLLMNPDFGRDSLTDVQEMLASMRRISRQIETGKGLLGAAINDVEWREQVIGDLAGIVTNMNELLMAAQDPSTPLGSLLARNEEGPSAVQNLRQASDAVPRAAERMERGEGLIGRLINDPEYADRVLDDLELTLRNLASITGKIDRGEGTLGGFVNDPALYQGVRDVVTGLQSSRLLRWMVDRYGRRGAERREGSAESP